LESLDFTKQGGVGLGSQGKLVAVQLGTLIALGKVGWDLALKESLAQYFPIGNLDCTRQVGWDVALNTNLHSTLYNWDFECTRQGGMGLGS
jgi:hypothetical protein